MKFNKTDIVVLSIIFALLLLLFFGTYHKYKPQYIEKEVVRVDTLYVKDTISIVEPLESKKIVYVDKYITDTITINSEPILVELPLEEATYKTDTFKAVITGVHPKLEYIEIYQNNKIINKEITKYKNDYSRHSIGLNIGASAIWIDGKPEIVPTISVGWNIDLIRWRKR